MFISAKNGFAGNCAEVQLADTGDATPKRADLRYFAGAQTGNSGNTRSMRHSVGNCDRPLSALCNGLSGNADLRAGDYRVRARDSEYFRANSGTFDQSGLRRRAFSGADDWLPKWMRPPLYGRIGVCREFAGILPDLAGRFSRTNAAGKTN